MISPHEQLGPVLQASGPELSRLLHSAETRLGQIVESYGPELARFASGLLAAGGKRLRPLLVFLCAGTYRRELVSAAVSVELLHMATLVHDDVLDGAAMRRGRPTVFAAGGRRAATATGDLLFSRAFAELASTGDAEAVRALSQASSALARGELMQRADAWAEEITPERYLERCRLKTASLFEAACRLGALFGGLTRDTVAALGRFGARIGMAFQIFDDVLDVSGPTERTGKPRGADLLDGTVNLPLILARRRDPDLRALDLRSVVTDGAQAGAVCDRIALTGALGEARERALRYVVEAKATIGEVPLPDGRRRGLDLVAEAVVERYA
jgi:geranylgeranyl pyrophosphate synthase